MDQWIAENITERRKVQKITIAGPASFAAGSLAHYTATFAIVPGKLCIKISANSGEPSFFAPNNAAWSADGLTLSFTITNGNPVAHTLYVADCLNGAVSSFSYTVTP